ncbi:MAG: peptidoglycan DD-metalloendopeptidase family protein [Chitinophagales bacterium]
MSDYLKNKKVIFPAIGLFLVIITIGAYLAVVKNIACSVGLNGKEILIADNAEQVKANIDKICAGEQKKVGSKVSLANKLTYRTVIVNESEVVEPEEIPALLEKSLDLKAQAVAIVIDGKPVVYVTNQMTAKKLLQDIKNKYALIGEKEKIQSINYVEKINLKNVQVASARILPYKEALAYLTTGNTNPQYYEVKEGDTLWWIARNHDMHVKDIMAGNNLKGEKLDLGQKLVLTSSRPFVNVVATVQGTKVEVIPFTTRVTINKAWKYTIKEKQAGKDGEKKVTYVETRRNGSITQHKVVSEIVTKKPVDRVVMRGTKREVTVASSRSGSFIGGLIWPIFGTITTRFSGHHTGIDIDLETGDGIRAAAAGTVTFAGRDGGYGLMVTINHGNGLSTRYAHCSKLLVSQGQKVSRGQTIAKGGSTGHSTGSHLHFEVLKSGSFGNPLRYLN